jgi:hypothetical protein
LRLSLFPRLIRRADQRRRAYVRHVIVSGAVLGLVFLHEPLTLRKALGILLAAISIYLIEGHPGP